MNKEKLIDDLDMAIYMRVIAPALPHLRYLSYVLRHKLFVAQACFAMGLYRRGVTHDLSKFLPSEWFAYVESFYGKERTLKVRAAFDTAWLRHQHRNPHHWQYWLLRKDNGNIEAIEMPNADVLEMVCDWHGAGKAQGHESCWADTTAWFEKNVAKMHLHPYTRGYITRLLWRLQKGLPVR